MRMRAYMLLMCFVVSLSPQMDMSVLTELWRLTDPTEPRFCVAVIAIIFNPFFWNVVSHCICLLLVCFITVAMKGHPPALMALGSVFVISSFMALGVTGTFLGKSIHLCFCSTSILSYTCLTNRYSSNIFRLFLMILTAVVDLSYKVAIAFEGAVGATQPAKAQKHDIRHQKAMQV
uniref:Uncharacterized protein n=1 Tax=Sinocyclocheilus rhinocerous TaxID=307959 RepID=A0A673J872_9TELE